MFVITEGRFVASSCLYIHKMVTEKCRMENLFSCRVQKLFNLRLVIYHVRDVNILLSDCFHSYWNVGEPISLQNFIITARISVTMERPSVEGPHLFSIIQLLSYLIHFVSLSFLFLCVYIFSLFHYVCTVFIFLLLLVIQLLTFLYLYLHVYFSLRLFFCTFFLFTFILLLSISYFTFVEIL